MTLPDFSTHQQQVMAASLMLVNSRGYVATSQLVLRLQVVSGTFFASDRQRAYLIQYRRSARTTWTPWTARSTMRP